MADTSHSIQAALGGNQRRFWTKKFDMAKHHPDLVFCRKQPGISLGRLCEKCDGKCVVCDSYVRPHVLVHICDECNYGSFEVGSPPEWWSSRAHCTANSRWSYPIKPLSNSIILFNSSCFLMPLSSASTCICAFRVDASSVVLQEYQMLTTVESAHYRRKMYVTPSFVINWSCHIYSILFFCWNHN